MKFSLASFGAVGAIFMALQPALATVVITSPVAATSVKGDKRLRVTWQDDGKAPKLSDWGGINIYLAAGSQNVQFKLQRLASNVAVTKTTDTYKVDSTIGPSGQYYFVRMESTKVGAGGIPSMSFSARFQLTGMTGTFNSTVLAAAKGKEGPSSDPTSSVLSTVRSSSTSTFGRTSTSPSPLSSSAPLRSNSTSDAGIVSIPQVAAAIGAMAAGALVML